MSKKILFWGMGVEALKWIRDIQLIRNSFTIIGFTQTVYNEEEEKCINSFGFNYVPFEILREENVDYLCIICRYEWEIRKTLFENGLYQKAIITDINEILMMYHFGLSINKAYQELYKCIPKAVKNTLCSLESYKYLKREYTYVLLEQRELTYTVKPKVFIDKDITPIWMIWLQGIENAPSVIQLCIERIKKILKKNEQLFVLDENTLFEYIDLPEYVTKKFKNGVIGPAQFVDLVRLRLINIYGGVYIDSDIYFMSDSLPEYAKGNRMFVYSLYANWKNYVDPQISSSWLISAEPKQRILVILENMLCEYFLKENKLIHWLIWHQFFTIIAEAYPEDFENIETVLTWPSTILAHEINDAYDEKRFNHIKRMADAQILSHRETHLLKTSDGRDTFYSYLLRQNNID